ncbi:MAG TPA: hypothetical protein PLY38_03880, partial [Candidatus Hydrothermia bacterium]|nr:hypothetical protein [Candidatus Hydrothermia bacterium]
AGVLTRLNYGPVRKYLNFIGTGMKFQVSSRPLERVRFFYNEFNTFENGHRVVKWDLWIIQSLYWAVFLLF